MSDNIPLDLHVEILKSFPVKTLLQFRSVSKSWKSLIDSPRFVGRYSSQQQRLLVRDTDKSYNPKYDYIVDDDTFPHHRVSITFSPQCDTLLECYTIIGSSHGLFCLLNFSGTKAVIWNPSIRKAVDVVLPKVTALAVVVPNAFYATVLGFGVCRETSDPKIVKVAYHIISNHRRNLDVFSVSGVRWQVEVFTLSTGSWRSSYNTNLSHKSIRISEYDMVVIDGVHYWLAKERIAMDGDESRIRMLIVSFDVTTEEFREVNLPDSLANPQRLKLYEMRGSLVVLQHSEEANKNFYSVWMMEESVSKSFTKLLTFNSHPLDLPHYNIRGFRKTGELIIVIDGANHGATLAVYEPSSKSLSYIGVIARGISQNVYSYMESLLLL